MRKKRINKIMIIVVLFLFMVMGIGYSYLSKTLGVSGNVTVKEPGATICKENRGISANGKLCKRAEKLHSEICNNADSSYYCMAAGYSLGDNIVYGNCGTSGELKSGDAFDCDVDGDGVYDSNTERFYYVSDYYDTITKDFNSDYATLIYYNNVKSGEPDNKAAFMYDSSGSNYHGPVTGYVELPSTSQWSKVVLLKYTRQVLNEKAETIAPWATSEKFTYTDKAARFLTVQEVNKACGITVGDALVGELDTCEYLLENTYYSSQELLWGWWTESNHSKYSPSIWFVVGAHRFVRYCDSNTEKGVRPAIDVLKTNMSY